MYFTSKSLRWGLRDHKKKPAMEAPIVPPRSPAGRAAEPPANCRHCPALQHCLPAWLDEAGITEFERVVVRRLAIPRHQRMFGLDAPFEYLYAIRSGQFKGQRASPGGGAQITGFYMPGELLGLEAISTGQHASEAVALTDSTVCALPYAMLTPLLGRHPPLLKQFHHVLSGEIARQQSTMLLLGNARAPQRLAAFLLDQGARSAAQGDSADRFALRMSRDDIAAYLGLTGESISRLLSMLRQDGILNVSNRAIDILDAARLREVATPLEPA